MKEPETRIEKDFGIDGMVMAQLGEEIFRDPEYQEKAFALHHALHGRGPEPQGSWQGSRVFHHEGAHEQ